MLKGNRILIFGAAGSIGSELFRQLVEDNHVLGFDIDEARMYDLYEEYNQKGYDVHYRIGDIRDKELVRSVITDFKPDTIFHAAAYKNVVPMEQFPREAVQTNILGTLNILELAKEYGVEKLINISTDKVVNATNIMGVSKKMAEIITQRYGYVSVRFGNVLGSRGSVIEIWQRQINNSEPITVTDEKMTRYMMSIQEACELVIKAAEIGEPGSIMIMDMGEKVNVLKLAQDILNKSGKKLDIKMIGLRPGEILTEQLMTPEEQSRAKRVDNFWVIENAKN